MLAACTEADVKSESNTAPTTNLDLRRSARRASRPTLPWLESRCATSGRLPEVDFVGRPTVQPSVRPIAVVPRSKQRQLFAKGAPAAGDHDSPCATVLHRENEPLDDGDAAVLADGTEPLTDSLSTTPLSDSSRDELLAVIGDQVLRCGTRRSNRPTEKHGDSCRCRRLIEDSKAHDATREVIDRHGNPPTERRHQFSTTCCWPGSIVMLLPRTGSDHALSHCSVSGPRGRRGSARRTS